MTELSPTARALLDAARSGLSPDDAATARVRDTVAASIAGGAAAGASAKLAIAGKLAIVAVVGGLAAAVYVMTRDREPEPVPAIELAPEVPVAHSEQRATANVEPAPPKVEHPATSVPAATANVERRAATAHATAAPRPEPAIDPAIEIEAPHAADLAREVALIDQAMAALRHRDAGGALAAIGIYDRETGGRGQLAEDAAAISVEAMCLRGDSAAGAKLDAFDRRWPHSAQRSRLSAACHR